MSCLVSGEKWSKAGHGTSVEGCSIEICIFGLG
jgi:hypothetical protein